MIPDHQALVTLKAVAESLVANNVSILEVSPRVGIRPREHLYR